MPKSTSHLFLIKSIKYFLFVAIFQSCTKENAFDCFTSNGKDITEERILEYFSKVEVNDNFEITIKNDNVFKVEVTAGEHIIKNISTSLENNILQIHNKNRCNFVRGYKRKIQITISAPSISELTDFGVGTITFAKDYKQDSIIVNAENVGDIYLNGTFKEVNARTLGNADIYMSGESNSLHIYMNGPNYLNAENFLVKNYLYISTYSFGDARLNLNGLGLFDYYIWSSGNIYYSGQPSTIRNLNNTSAKGSLIKLD